ncbi:hypothetical protein [Paenibacillus sp. y28]|uniref:hypothetical protein n=1 Tax=Paenibacillus sp. y28 TaxID=3129110 RepID=UPI00301958A1
MTVVVDRRYNGIIQLIVALLDGTDVKLTLYRLRGFFMIFWQLDPSWLQERGED